MIHPVEPKFIVNQIIQPNKEYPNNPFYPFLIYKQVFQLFENHFQKDFVNFFKKNHWINAWINGVYNFDHYHSNTHETLFVFSGMCIIQIGGKKENTFEISTGDVIIIPAGVSHKNLNSSSDFITIGSYPSEIKYDMNYGKPEERLHAEKNIKQVPLPLCDPVFGKYGLLFNYWK